MQPGCACYLVAIGTYSRSWFFHTHFPVTPHALQVISGLQPRSQRILLVKGLGCDGIGDTFYRAGQISAEYYGYFLLDEFAVS